MPPPAHITPILDHPDRSALRLRLEDWEILDANISARQLLNGGSTAPLEGRSATALLSPSASFAPLFSPACLQEFGRYGVWQGWVGMANDKGRIRSHATLLPAEDGAEGVALLLLEVMTPSTAAAEQSDSKYHTFIQRSITGFFVVGAQGEIAEVNPVFADMLGYTVDELQSMHLSEIEAVESPEESARHMHKILEEGFDRFESRHRHRDGSLVEVEVSVNFDTDFGPHFYSFVRDITERKRAQEQLRASQAQLAEAQRIAHIGSWEWELGSNRLTWSDEVFRQFGLPPGGEAPTIELYVGLCHPDDRAQVHAALQATLERDAPFSLEARMLRHDTQEPWVMHAQGHLRRGPEGQPLHFICTQQDITKRKQAEEELRLHTEIVAHMAEGVHLTTHDGTILFTNAKLDEMFGYQRGELIGRHVSTLNAPVDQDPQQLAEEIINDLKQTGFWKGEVHNMRKDGTPFWCSASVSGFSHYHYGPVFISVHSDIQHQKEAQEANRRLEEKLNQARKMQAIGTLAGGIAHEFNNLLGVIQGNAELLQDQLPAEGAGPRQNGRILRASRQAKELVSKILTFSRSSTQSQTPHAIEPLLRETVDFLRSSIPSSVTIDLQLAAPGLHARVNPDEIQQLLLNLFSNAVHAMDEAGRITLALHPVTLSAAESVQVGDLAAGDYLELAVSDTGRGMDAAMLERIFEPFFTTKEVGKGSGMGLALVYGILEGLGGGLQVTSTPGMGSCFRLYLPLCPAPLEPPAPRIAPPPLGRGRILLVDDQQDVAATYTELLTTLGYQVECFTDSGAALSAFEHDPQRFDLVVTDQVMPGIQGTELSRRLLAIRPDLPIVLCTGYSEQVDQKRAQQLGIHNFMLKPCSLRDFADVLARLTHITENA